MSETIGIRYCIPQVVFDKKPSGNQTFALFYRRGDNPNRSWIKKTDTYVVDKYGKNTNNVYLDSLVEDTDYQFSLAEFPYEDEQTAAKNGAIFSFHTAINMTAGDSPYVNKILMPGQTFDWYYSGTKANSMPTSSATAWYYQATNNRTNEGENYYSLEVGGEVAWKQATSADNELETYSGYYCNTGNYIKLPNTYVKNPGGFIAGRIYADDIRGLLTVSFYLEEGHKDAAIVTCEALYNNTGSEQAPIYTQIPIEQANDATAAISFSIYVGEDGVLHSRKVRKSSVANGGEITLNEDTALPNTMVGGITNLSTNKWYTAQISHGLGTVHIYTAKGPEELQSSSQYYTEVYTCEGPGQPAESSIANAGDPATDGLGIGFGYNPEVLQSIFDVIGTEQYVTKGLIVNHIGMLSNESITDFNKISAGYLYIPCLGFYPQGGTISKANCLYLQNSSMTNLFKDDTIGEDGQVESVGKVSFIIDPAIGGTDSPKLNSGTYKIVLQSYSQYTSNTSFTNMDGIIVQTQKEQVTNTGYVIDFEQDFDSAVNAFRSKFYTKHGNWGGYNGGVNSNLVYASRAEKSLILEAHGDYYPESGQVWGVGKEAWVTEAGKQYTGYGENMYYYAENDARKGTTPFKQRVGCTLRTVDYFAYGKYTVRMAIPELKAGQDNWGLCPALWFFHYQEFGEGSTGYNKWMSSTNPVGRIYNKEGDAENGFYCVVNNEIDMELPSNDTQDFFPTAAVGGTRYTPWDFVKCAYFDPITTNPKATVPTAINPPYRIGIVDDNTLPYEDVGRFILKDPAKPNDRASWEQERETFVQTNYPNFCNCKFNNWQGEYSSGNGWESRQGYLPAKVNGAMPADAVATAQANNMDYYKNDTTYKEEYVAYKTALADERVSPKGYADGRFHEWTMVWYPNHTELWVDGVKVEENWGFVPFNCMHFVIGIWFPTLSVKKIDGVWKVLDYDKKTPVNNVATLESTGTWAGLNANFEAWHLKISKVKYEPLTTEELNANTANRPTPELLYDGESFPESGMRFII